MMLYLQRMQALVNRFKRGQRGQYCDSGLMMIDGYRIINWRGKSRALMFIVVW